METLAHPEAAGVRGPALKGIRQFLALLNDLRALPGRAVAPVVERLIMATDFERHLRTTDNAEERIENVRELVSAAAEFNRAEPEADVAAFLEQVALVSDIDKWDAQRGTVTLMTLHAAKGLEFPHVYVIGLEEGLLPLAGTGSHHDIEEERRLLFVGMTRAMKRATLTFAECRTTYGKRHYTEPSRFLSELPEEAVEGAGLLSAAPLWRQRATRRSRTAQRPAGAVVRRVRRSETEELVYDGEMPEDDGYAVGDRVGHPEYGRGEVIGIQGYGDRAKVRVRFHAIGIKLLVLRYANLRKV
jgi:DNA helicase-2/ATP-dependent DNA helicase PcrA